VQDTEFDFDVFFNLSTELLCVVGLDGCFRKINPAFQKLLGYSEKELNGELITNFIHINDRKTTDIIREKLKGGTPLNNFENRYLSKSGEVLWLSWTSKRVPGKNLIYGMAKLVNPKKEMEAKRNELIKELSSTNEKLKQLTIIISHDLRSPVNNLLALFDLLDNEQFQDQETIEIVDLLQKSTMALKTRLDDFLTSLKKEELLFIKVESLSFQDILNQSTSAIKSLIKNSNAKIISNFSEVPTIHFNKSYLESVFLNLISNAIKYTRPDIGPVIKIRSYSKAGITLLSVKDNGIGFDMEKVEKKIFGFDQKFHNNEESQGIGLYLVHNHVAALGGKIEVKSKPDRGTEFVVYFKN